MFAKKEIRFLFVGGINTAVGYGFYALFIFLGLSSVAATSISTPIGTVNSYFWNKYFTFASKEKSIVELIKFVGVYAVSYVLNLILVWALEQYTGINEYLIGVIGLFVTTIISYVGHNSFSFKKTITENKK